MCDVSVSFLVPVLSSSRAYNPETDSAPSPQLALEGGAEPFSTAAEAHAFIAVDLGGQLEVARVEFSLHGDEGEVITIEVLYLRKF